MSPVVRRFLKTLGWTLAISLATGILAIGTLAVWVASRKEVFPAADIPIQSRLMESSFAPAADRSLQILQKARSDRHFPSVSMAVGVNGRLVWAGAVGYEDLAAGRPASIDSRYYVASIAKFFTSVALGQLVEEQKVDLTASFHSVVPNFPSFAQDFTLAQLQKHQAGIRHWRVRDLLNRHWYGSVREASLNLAGERLRFKPGTRTSYSTPGYTLLALAMEKAAAENYPQLIQRLVLAPAGMYDTFLDSSDRSTQRRVTPYFVNGGSMVRIPEFNVSDRWAGGGFLSTPSDVVRFGNAVLQGNMLSARFRAKVLRLQSGIDDLPGIFSEEQSPLGMKLTGGGTGWSGRSSISIYPERGIVVAVSTNTRPADDRGAGIDQDAIAALFAAVVASPPQSVTAACAPVSRIDPSCP